MSEDQQHKHDHSHWLLDILPWIVSPILPLLGGVCILGVLYDKSAFSFQSYGDNGQFIDVAKRGFTHFESLMTYASVGLVHVALCMLATGYFVMQIMALPGSARTRAWRLVCILIPVLVIMGVVAASTNAAAVALTFHNVCDLLLLSNAAPHILSETCRGSAVSSLFWLAVVPVAAGIVAAIFASAVVAGSVTHTTGRTRESEWRAEFPRTAMALQRNFYVVSVILVTSTVLTMLFLQLPLELTKAGSEIKLAATSHAQGMTVFWGTVFTLTLFAIFAPSACLLAVRAREHELASATPSEVRDWLEEQIFTSVPKRLSNIAASLAPLLVGPASMLLEKLTGGG